MDPSSSSTSATPEMDPSSSSADKLGKVMYTTKAIQFFDRTVSIILQNHNGSCPLISICNFLSLNNKLQLDPYIQEVPEEQLLEFVAGHLIDLNSKIDNKDPDYVKKQQQKIDDAIALLPKLTTGIHVNIKFTSINDFEYTPARAIFDLLDIRLYHGWIVDPQDIKTKKAIGSKSYDFIMDELVSLEQAKEFERIENLEEDSVAPTTEAIGVSSPSLSRNQSFTDSHQREKKGDMEEAEQISRALKVSMAEASKRSCESAIESSECVLNSSIGVGVDSGCIDVDPKERLTIAQGELIRRYLNSSQLTAYGLLCLKNELEENELCVLFRNDHFNTMFKYQGELYLLASDQAFKGQPNYVWEKLNKVNGDNVHVMANFKEFRHSHVSLLSNASLQSLRRAVASASGLISRPPSASGLISRSQVMASNSIIRQPKTKKDFIVTLELQNGWVYKLGSNNGNKDFEEMNGRLKVHALMVWGGSKIHNEMELDETDNWELDFIAKLLRFWPSLQGSTSSWEFWEKEYNKHGIKILPPRDYFQCSLDLRHRIETSLQLKFNVLEKISNFYNEVMERLKVDVQLRLQRISNVTNESFRRIPFWKTYKDAYLLSAIRVRIDVDTMEYEEWEKGVFDIHGDKRIENLEAWMIVPNGKLKGIIASVRNSRTNAYKKNARKN